jgi:hypothetical protein
VASTRRFTAIGCTRSARGTARSESPCPEEAPGFDGVNLVSARPSQSLASNSRATEPCEDPLPDQVPLELGDRGQHVEEELPGRRGRVNRLIEDHQVHAKRLEFLPEADQVMRAPGENDGTPEKVAMLITGHKIRAVFDRYHIVASEDLRAATARMAARGGHVSGHVGRDEVAPRAASVQNDSMRL